MFFYLLTYYIEIPDFNIFNKYGLFYICTSIFTVLIKLVLTSFYYIIQVSLNIK